MLTRDELMRHEAAGITTAAFPKALRLGGIDCAADYLHEPGDAKDGVTVTVPIYALNQVSEERCEWLVPGMLKDKVLALVKSLHQRPRSRLVPLPDYAAEFCARRTVRARRADRRAAEAGARAHAVGGAAQRLQARPACRAHLFMNFRVVDEHGRQLAHGPQPGGAEGRVGRAGALALPGAGDVEGGACAGAAAAAAAAAVEPRAAVVASAPALSAHKARSTAGARSTPRWTFGELPELMEVRKGGQTLVGFPALIDKGAIVEIEVFDEPAMAAAASHRSGLRRLVALQLKEPLKYLEKNIPDLQKMAAAFMPLGTLEELREQIIAVALDRAFLAEPLPTDARSFGARIDEGRARLNLIAQEVARLAGVILSEYAAALRKLKDSRAGQGRGRRHHGAAAAADAQALLAAVAVCRRCSTTALPEGGGAAAGQAAGRPGARRRAAGRAAAAGAALPAPAGRAARHSRRRLDEYRWLLEELRVSLFAQELRTPQPVSVKRLDRAWTQLQA